MKVTDADKLTIHWPVVLAALCGGVAAAMQIGKASAAMPLLRAEFGVSVSAASSYLAMVSLGAALLGLAVGIASQRTGALRAGIAGLAILSVASLFGAFATSWSVLYAVRLAEALGLPLVVASMPALIQAACGPKHRVIGLGVWAAWLPLGVACAMFMMVAVDDVLGWRALYAAAALLPALAIAALVATRPAVAPLSSLARWPDRAQLSARLLGMGAVFGLFSAIYLTFMAFLPSVADAELGLGLDKAAILAGCMALLIVVGNMLATFLMVRGVSPRTLLVIAFAVMAASASLFLFTALPGWQRILAGVAFNLAAGVAPGVIWTFVPVLSLHLGVSASLVSGVFYQAAGAGQLIGPTLAGVMVDGMGSWLAILFVIVPGAAFAIALCLDRRIVTT